MLFVQHSLHHVETRQIQYNDHLKSEDSDETHYKETDTKTENDVFILNACFQNNIFPKFMSPVSLILHIKSTVNSCPQLLLLEQNYLL